MRGMSSNQSGTLLIHWKRKVEKTRGTIYYRELQYVGLYVKIKNKKKSRDSVCVYIIYIYIRSVTPETSSVVLCAINTSLPKWKATNPDCTKGTVLTGCFKDCKPSKCRFKRPNWWYKASTSFPQELLQTRAGQKGSYFMRKQNLKRGMYKPLISKLLQHLQWMYESSL